MVRALIVCNPKSGRGKAIKYSNLIKNSLDEYSSDILICDSLEMLEDAINNKIKDYDLLVICGGDGTFHQTINYLCKTPYRPKIAYIPLGTACDTGKNLGMSKNVKKSLKIIKENNLRKMPILKANDIYVCYAMATGKYVSTSYLTNSKLKILGPIGYLVMGLLELFLDYSLNLYVNDYVNPTNYKTKVVCVLNTRSIGSITLKNIERKIVSIKDNVIISLMRIVLSKRILSKKDVVVLPLNKDYIINIGKQTWSVDGEKVIFEGDIKITHDACVFDVFYNDKTAK